jgi:dipeptidyl aminopeptidase/acylaminoacyl peptidase
MGIRRLAVVAVAVAVLAACGAGGDPEGAPAAGAAPPDRPALAVEVRTEPFVDATRGTDASGSAPASPTRAAPTRIFAPAGGQSGRPYPLVVFVHGSGGLGDGYDRLLRTWASAGYVVAAPALPGSTDKDARGDWTADLPHFPADVRFVIDELLRVNRAGEGPLLGSVDPDRIGLAGHSMGGMITLAVAGNTCCHDGRVKAAVVLAGRETPFGGGQFWARIRTPVLLVHGDGDTNVTYADGRRAYASAPPPRFLLTIIGGDHGSPFSGDPADGQARLVTEAALDFFGHYLKGDTDGLAHLQARASAPGVARLEQER